MVNENLFDMGIYELKKYAKLTLTNGAFIVAYL